MKKRTHIVAAIILHPQRDRIFITRRAQDAHQGGLWEFPGGKVEAQETIEVAINRELQEEVGITVTEQSVFAHFDYDYPDKALVFDFILVDKFQGQPFGKEGQQGQWVAIEQLAQFDFPTANQPIVEQVMSQFSGKQR
ncbi:MULTISPECIES: 8-oxo-dGTP diphosphatase MutT [unclassified Vibrio]|uniref:8-oxo-dGTP diphosphatase n=1 Tax=Vibrio sp. HB236076 TaxID=3232307 RepID=A0AB39HHU9_9VIBR|nr:8-oxo-dGTP diphosphatase MutT [Vibrio sp. HB161653]MDP5254554.1 8-oxo-dGTP diphosphatase MutT [Vibrio sp. HB161653]